MPMLLADLRTIEADADENAKDAAIERLEDAARGLEGTEANAMLWHAGLGLITAPMLGRRHYHN